MKWLTAQLLIVLAAALAGGCDKHENAHASGANAARPAPAFGNGAISGRVNFVGTAPVMKKIDNQICGPHAQQIFEESVVINSNGTLANVLVYLEGVAASDGSGNPPVALDQVNCRYAPHVLGVQVGQTLRISNGDPTIHNVHMPTDVNTPVNFGMVRKGDVRELTFRAPEIVRVRCDVHPWMNAFIGVFDHPFFAVSGSNGTFSIPRVPPGQYTLVAWHERYGEQRQSIDVSDRPIEADFTYDTDKLN